jgi:hypothetical protein
LSPLDALLWQWQRHGQWQQDDLCHACFRSWRPRRRVVYRFRVSCLQCFSRNRRRQSLEHKVN